MKSAMLVLALACTAGTAMASDIFSFNDNNVTGVTGGGYSSRDAVGVFGARMAVFSPAGGAFLDDATGGAGPNLHNFGLTESMGVGAGNTILISSTQTILPNGNQQLVFSVFTQNGNAFVPQGAAVGGQVINAFQFDIGTPNAPADPVNFDQNISIVSATFTISSATASFGPFGSTVATPGGNSLTLRSGVSAGTDITGFLFNRMDVTVELTKVIPAPASLALLGLGGLVATRRRR